jgi:hypothetical protein
VKPRTVAQAINEGNLALVAANLGLGEVFAPLKRTFTGLTSNQLDLTKTDAVGETTGLANPNRRALLVKGTLRVTGGAAAHANRKLSDGADPATTGIANISNDGKVITFEDVVSDVVIEYIPQCKVPLGSCSAMGIITTVTVAKLLDNDYFVLGDGSRPRVTFEYKATGGYVHTAGRVTIDVSALITAADVSAATAAAISAVGLGLKILPFDLGGLIVLECTIPGAGGNVSIDEAVADAGFVAVGMTGGQDAQNYAPTFQMAGVDY